MPAGNAPKRPPGRPKGSHKLALTPHVLTTVEKLAALGMPDETMASVLGISADTIGRRKQDTPEFAEAYARGKASAEVAVANTLYNAMKGGNISAAIWIEKTRFNRAERVRVDERSVDVSTLSDEQLARLAAGDDLASVSRQ